MHSLFSSSLWQYQYTLQFPYAHKIIFLFASEGSRNGVQNEISSPQKAKQLTNICTYCIQQFSRKYILCKKKSMCDKFHLGQTPKSDITPNVEPKVVTSENYLQIWDSSATLIGQFAIVTLFGAILGGIPLSDPYPFIYL